jgi:hypothetical protein
MSISQRLAIWRIRWSLRIGWGVSDATILRGVDNLNWRALAAWDREPGEVLGRLYELLGAAPVRVLVLRAASQPRGWTPEAKDE